MTILITIFKAILSENGLIPKVAGFTNPAIVNEIKKETILQTL